MEGSLKIEQLLPKFRKFIISCTCSVQKLAPHHAANDLEVQCYVEQLNGGAARILENAE